MATPPPFDSAAAEQVCRALGEAVTGAQIPNLIAPLKAPEGPGEETTTKWKRLFNAVAVAQNRQQDGRPLVRLVTDVMNPVRFTSQVEFEEHRRRVNEKLLFAGLSVLPDGKVGRESTAAKTVSEAQERADDLHAELTRRDVHPDVLRFCRSELLQQNYFHAVLEAAKSLADKMRSRAGVQADGSGLVDATCSISSGPKIAFNSLATEWERSEQNGIAMLVKGLFSSFRNPTAHAPKILWATSRAEALDMLTLTSMLHRRIDKATLQP